MSEKLYSTNEVAETLGVCSETVRNWLKTGKMSGKKLPNGIYRIKQSELDKALT